MYTPTNYHLRISFFVVALAATAGAEAQVITGIQGYWRFNETAGAFADSSGVTSNTGTAVGAAHGNGSNGLFGGALDLNGTSEYVDMGNPATLQMGVSDWSISTWAKSSTTNPASDRAIVAKGHVNAGWYRTAMDANGIAQGYLGNVGGGNQIANGGNIASDLGWHHVLTTYDRDGSLSIYRDGILQSTTNISAFSGVSAATTIDFTVGARESSTNPTGQFFPGAIDDTAVWRRVVTPQQAASIHGLGRLQQVALGDTDVDSLLNEIDRFLAAYNTQGSVLIDGVFWTFDDALPSNIVGTIGGSVAGNDAFVVLNSNGSGMMTAFVPEPASWALWTLIGIVGAAAVWRRAGRAKSSGSN